MTASPKTRRGRTRLAAQIVWALVLVVLLAGVAYLLAASLRFDERDAQSLADRQDLREELAESDNRLTAEEAARRALEQQIRGLGEKPVVVEPSEPGAPYIIEGPRGRSCIEELGYPRCRGARGVPGEDSTVPGEDGVNGQDGENGLDGQNGEPGKDGEPGRDGVDGKDGAPGRGIEDAQCNPETGRWVLDWNDGTTTDGGPCIFPAPPPNPDPGGTP